MSNGITLECTATIVANATAGTIKAVSIKTDPTVSSVTELQVPLSETWVFTDLYILASADAGTSNPVVNFDKNRGNSLVTSPPLATMLITNNTRPRFSPRPIGYNGGDLIRMFLYTTVANDAVADDIKFYVACSIS